jgi:uncharacterized membrane protein
MSFVRTLVMLASAVSIILVAYAFGHGLSTGELKHFVVSAVALGAAAVLVFLQVRIGNKEDSIHG